MTTATMIYRVSQGGASLSTLAALIAQPPVPLAYFVGIGAVMAADASIADIGDKRAQRGIDVSIAPSSVATATATVAEGRIQTVTVTGAGLGYGGRPVVRTVGGNPQTAASLRGVLNVNSTRKISGGSSYLAPTVAFVGGLLKGGIPATGTAHLTGSAVSSVTIDTPGGPYVSMPQIVISDTAGSGAFYVPLMSLASIEILSKGLEYESATPPTIEIVDLFESIFPTHKDRPFAFLMTTAIAKACCAPVETVPIVIT